VTDVYRRQHQQQQLERGDFSPCLSPSGFDSKEPFDFHIGNQISHLYFFIQLRLPKKSYMHANTYVGVSSHVASVLFSPNLFYAGTRMLNNPHDILLRRKMEEQAELQQVLEFQQMRLKSLHLPDFKNNPVYHHQRSFSVGAPLPFPHQLHSHVNHAGLSSDNIEGDITG
jgi:hypothetical protein